jgi:hypothetical protein
MNGKVRTENDRVKAPLEPAPPEPAAPAPLPDPPLRRLQRATGNLGVQQLLSHRDGDNGEPENYDLYFSLPTIFQKDPTLSTYSSEQRVAMLRAFLDYPGSRTGEEYWVLTAIWGTFGDDLVRVAAANPQVWEDSLVYDFNNELKELPQIERVREAFRRDIKELTTAYLDRNQQLIDQEYALLGIRWHKGAYREMQPQSWLESQRREEVLEDFRKTAELTLEAQWMLDTMLRTQVAYWQGYDPLQQAERGEGYRFQPGKPPSGNWNPYTDEIIAKGRDWDLTLGKHDELQPLYEGMQQQLGQLTRRHPVLYAAISSDRLYEVAHGQKMGQPTDEYTRQRVAKETIVQLLEYTLGKIGKTRQELGSTEFLYELRPIQDQLFAGEELAVSISDHDWTNPFFKGVGSKLVEDYRDAKFWEKLGIGILAAAAFVFAELATGGLATAFLITGLGATGYQVYEAYQDLQLAEKVETAEKVEVAAEYQLAYPGQSEAIRLGALIDLAFAAFDVFGGAKTAFRLGTAAKGVGFVPESFAKGTAALGKAGVTRVATEEALQKLPGAIGRAAEHLAKGEIKEADNLLKLAIDAHGPEAVIRQLDFNYKALAAALGENSSTIKSLRSFRDNTLGREIKQLFPAAERTGSVGEFANDFDWNILGPQAAKLRDEAVSYLIGRTGLSASDLERKLGASFFTDPRRLVLYEQLPQAAAERVGA